jgi:hypothetical protein
VTLQEKNKEQLSWLIFYELKMNCAEHWDVIEKEVTKEESKSGLPMFKDYFAD